MARCRLGGGSQAISPTVQEKHSLALQDPDLASQELSQVFAVRTKLIITTGWLWLAVAGWKKSNSDECVSSLIIILSRVKLKSSLWLQRPEFYWIVAPTDPSEFDRNPLSSPSPQSPIGHSNTQAPGWQLTFYSFSLYLSICTQVEFWSVGGSV